MKNKWILRGASCALTVLAVALAGCSASSGTEHYEPEASSAAYAEAAPAAAPAPTPYGGMMFGASEQFDEAEDAMAQEDVMMTSGMEAAASSQASPDAIVAQQNRKLVKHSDMQLQTKEFDTAIAQITQMIEQAGGYVESQQVSGRGMDDPIDRGTARSAYINARIPADRLDEVGGKICGVCHVLSKSERIEDIGEQYFDTQARLKSLSLQEERLLEILGKAEKLEDVITLESALSGVRYEIETLTASVRRMDSQVQYSFLNLSLNEVVDYEPVNDIPRTFGDRMALALQNSGSRVVKSMERTLVNAVEGGPVFVWNLLVLVVVLVLGAKLVQLVLRLMGVKNTFTKGRLLKHRVKTPAGQSASEVTAEVAPTEPVPTDKTE